VVIGRKPGGDGGADIPATDPRGRDFAVQCKRYALTKTVSVNDVRELNGALPHEHPKRLGMIVTTSRLTLPAEQPAKRSGIEFGAPHPALASQMVRVRHEVDRKDGQAAMAAPSANPRPPKTATGHPRLSRPGRVTASRISAGIDTARNPANGSATAQPPSTVLRMPSTTGLRKLQDKDNQTTAQRTLSALSALIPRIYLWCTCDDPVAGEPCTWPAASPGGL
jgi:hypothetical protein